MLAKRQDPIAQFRRDALRGCGFSLFLDELSSTFFSSDLEDLGFKAGFITVWGLTTGAATSSTFFKPGRGALRGFTGA